MQISVIIPTLNEADHIGRLVSFFRDLPEQDFLAEVIVVDGGSGDSTVALARQAGAQVLEAPRRGRAVQMNYAAERAMGEILYFVHADVLPPANCLYAIKYAVLAGHVLGGFAYRFDSPSWLLRFNSFFTRFDWMANGGGDQTLFVRRDRFAELGGFNEQLSIMEDFDFVWRAKKHYPYHLIKDRALVSARKYEQNSWLKVQLVNAWAFFAFRLGASSEELAQWYRKMLS